MIAPLQSEERGLSKDGFCLWVSAEKEASLEVTKACCCSKAPRAHYHPTLPLGKNQLLPLSAPCDALGAPSSSPLASQHCSHRCKECSPQSPPAQGLLSPEQSWLPALCSSVAQRGSHRLNGGFPPFLFAGSIYQPAKGSRNLFQGGCFFPSAHNNVFSCV